MKEQSISLRGTGEQDINNSGEEVILFERNK